VNYALQPMTRDAFIEMMTADLPEVPAYFGRDVQVNREGPPLVAERDPLPPLAIDEFERRAQVGAVVLDTRSAAAFGAAHVPGALHIGLDGQFASWAGTLLPAGTPILLVTDGVEEAEEARMRLARVGLDEAAGYLAGGIAAWSASGRPVASTEQITVDELAARLREDRCRVLDVRRPPEWRTAHISAAVGRPLADLGTGLPELPAGKAIAIICAGGYRSSIAASLFERAGRRDVVNVVGGMAAWNAAGLPTVA
jgi:hydroxyacylglutathione hydrolase